MGEPRWLTLALLLDADIRRRSIRIGTQVAIPRSVRVAGRPNPKSHAAHDEIRVLEREELREISSDDLFTKLQQGKAAHPDDGAHAR